MNEEELKRKIGHDLSLREVGIAGLSIELGKLQAQKEEIEFLMNMKIALMILGDKELEGMEDGQIMVLRRIKQLQDEIKEKEK